MGIYISNEGDLNEEDDIDYNDHSGLIHKIENFIKEYYIPVQDPKDAELHFTTEEIWIQLYKLFPSKILRQDFVANLLHLTGFTFYDYGEMRFEWIMKRA